MSNIREIAKLAGVSTATVSRTLSQPEKVSASTKEKVQNAIKQAKYRPNMMARNFRATRSYTLLVLVPNLSNPFFATLIRGIEDVCKRHGYSVLLGDTRDNEKNEVAYRNLVETKQADGLIQLMPHSPGSPLPPTHIPIVNAAGCEGTPYPTVRIDNRDAASSIVNHLITMGHQRIAVISGLKDNRHSVDRLKGYQESLGKAKIAFDPALVFEGDFSTASGQAAALQIMTMKHRPSAVFCMNDNMAIAAMQTFKSHGLNIPEDISITGFDDIEYARYTDPPLTTMRQPAQELGREAAKKLLALIEEEAISPLDHILPHELLIRNSVGKLN